MNKNVILSLDTITGICEAIDEVLSRDQVNVQEAMDYIGDIRQEVVSLAYNIQTIRNQIRIAGKNLTEAFEKVIQPPVEEENTDVYG